MMPIRAPRDYLVQRDRFQKTEFRVCKSVVGHLTFDRRFRIKRAHDAYT